MGGYRGMSGYWNQYDNCFGFGQLTTQQKNCKNDFVCKFVWTHILKTFKWKSFLLFANDR